MAQPNDVLSMLCSGLEWTLIGDKYEDINWHGAKPAITKAQYLAGFEAFDAWKAEQDAAKASAKSALLNRLGITAEEAALLLG